MEKSSRKIKGGDLIDLGYTPAKWFGDALKILNSGPSRPSKEEIKAVCDPLVTVEIELDNPTQKPITFFSNSVYTPVSSANKDAVLKSSYELMKTPTLEKLALMPDACPAGPIGTITVGGVARAKNAIHPGMHSADICCSMYATNLGKVISPKELLDLVAAMAHFGPNTKDQKISTLKSKRHLIGPDLMYRINNNFFTKNFSDLAISDLLTQGDGNHFISVNVSEKTGDLWLVTHFGSRSFGANVYRQGMKTAHKLTRDIAPKVKKENSWIPFDTKEGQDYWDALRIVRDWTYKNHGLLHSMVSALTGEPIKEVIWNPHNFVFRDGDYFYHAKGATPMVNELMDRPHEDGLKIIPLSMRDPILVVKNTDSNNLDSDSMGFAPHGAGRNMSRTQYAKMVLSEGKSEREVFLEETKGLDVRSYSGVPDVTELPGAYKNARDIQEEIEDFNLAQVYDRLLPYGCIMAGKTVFKRKKNRL